MNMQSIHPFLHTIHQLYQRNIYLCAKAVYAGTAVIEDKLNHPFIEMDKIAPALSRVWWKNVSIFIRKDQVMSVYGK